MNQCCLTGCLLYRVEFGDFLSSYSGNNPLSPLVNVSLRFLWYVQAASNLLYNLLYLRKRVEKNIFIVVYTQIHRCLNSFIWFIYRMSLLRKICQSVYGKALHCCNNSLTVWIFYICQGHLSSCALRGNSYCWITFIYS